MKKKLTKKDVQDLDRLQGRIEKLWLRFEENDLELHYGNGTASSQLSCACASIECILQEVYYEK